MVFRSDRLAAAGTTLPFNQEGYAAVRLTTANETYANQHSVTDTFANACVPYTTRAARRMPPRWPAWLSRPKHR